MPASLLLLLLALALTAIPLLVPHRRRQRESVKPTTLLGIYRDVLSDARRQRLRPSRVLLLLWSLAALFTTLLPLLLFLWLRYAPPAAPITRVALFAMAPIALAGAAGNFFSILLNAATFGFGTPPPLGPTLAFAYGVTAHNLLLAVLCLVLGFSPTTADALHRLLV